jgi:deazaflavin-dependent oxidoreductase (nitroreductase family)
MSEQNNFNQKVIDEFRANAGVVGGPFAGAPMILVTHTDAKSGTAYTMPLVCSMDEANPVIIASMGGAPVDPQWYRNMVANPKVWVELGTELFDATVRVKEGAERDRLFRAQADMMANFDEYAAKTTRVIPVIAPRHDSG